MEIVVYGNDIVVVFQLNDSEAAKALYAQLPLEIEVENYSDNEKIFYPPKKLETKNTPLTDAHNGTLAYYAPWGNVVMFYKEFGEANGLYELGRCIKGCEHIKNISGKIEIKK
jgi:hypothetical protein